MAITFAQAAASAASQWTVLITIEGVGDFDGISKFCAFRPSYAASDEHYRAILMGFPAIASERVDPLGGGVECGELSFDLLDVDDYLTGLLRTDAEPTTYVDPASGLLSKTATTVTVLDVSGLSTDSVIWIGNEALRVTGIAGLDLTVTRGALDTDPQVHNLPRKTSRVWSYPPYLRSRRVRLYLGPADNDDATEETLFWTGHLDGFSLSQDTNVFSISARSQLKYLDRLIYRHGSAGFKPTIYNGSIELESLEPRPVDYDAGANLFPHDNTGEMTAFVRMGDEILSGLWDSCGSNHKQIFTDARFGSERGILNTPIEDLAEEDHAAVVYVAQDSHPAASFRYSPDLTASGGSAPSTSRSSGTWISSSHFVDVLLCLLTSSADPDTDGGDGLELVNFESGFSNYSSLPRGIGAGVPAELISWSTWLDVKARTPGYTFPGFVLESESIPFAELAEKYFLRLVGAHLTTIDGPLGLILPRSPVASSTAPEFSLDTILSRGYADRARLPALSCSQDMGRVASAVRYKLRGPSGRTVTTTVTDAEFSDMFGQGGYYAAEDKTITIDAPAAITDPAHVHAALEESAQKKLRRFRRPQWRLSGLLSDFSLYATTPGSVVRVTHPGLVDENAGARGWTDVPAQVLEKTVQISDKTSTTGGGSDALGLHLEWTLLGYGPGGRFGRVAPAAVIDSISTPNVATCFANRTTRFDSGTAGLPSTDASTFEVGDVLELRTPSGQNAAPGSKEAVVSVTGNDVELSGDFSGALATGLVLSYSDHQNVTADQKSDHVFFADQATRTIGTGTDRPWQWGEP